MTTVKFRPARGRLFRDFDSALAQFFPRRGDVFHGTETGWSPRVDISESRETYEIHAELPGIGKNEIELSFRDNVLTLRGEKKLNETQDGKNPLRRESGAGTFERSFRFSGPVQGDAVTAKYRNGVLSITVPKADVPDVHTVEIR